MTRPMIAVMVALAMMAIAVPSAPSQTPDSLIVPGERIGPYRLGMTLAEVIGLLGSGGERGSTTMPRSYGMLWRNKRVFSSFFSASHTVSGVTLYDSDENRTFRTAEGVGLGSPSSEFDRFGQPEWRQQYQGGVEARAYWKVGLYTNTKEGKVTAIGVFDNRSQ